MNDKKKDKHRSHWELAYREPPYRELSDMVAGRVQAGPQSTPPRPGTDLDEWQDTELFHSPEL